MIRKPKGTKDVLPNEVYKWHHVENKFKDVCTRFGYREIRTPVFEFTKLFKRGVGETTDIVQKEMYTAISGVDLRKYVDLKSSDNEAGATKHLNDKGFTLKPEGTAPVVRAFVENKVYADTQPSKMFYITPCFRHERPQAGRLRQFHQFGVEVFGAAGSTADAEVIAIADTFFRELGLSNIELHVNSIGCQKCRPDYQTALKSYLEAKLPNLCETCNDRFNTNPMRIIDCKNPSCQENLQDVPVMFDYLCGECSDHFDKTQAYLGAMDIEYILDKKIVRGLDYYTKTAFEFISREIGSQATVCGGGRYDNLIENIDGPATPGVGFGLGIERLLMTLEGNGIEIPMPETYDVFFVALGDDARVKAVELLQKMRKAGLKGDLDHLGRSMKAQFKYSDKMNAKYNIIIGEQELEKGIAMLRDMASGEQIEVQLDQLVDDVLGKLAK